VKSQKGSPAHLKSPAEVEMKAEKRQKVNILGQQILVNVSLSDWVIRGIPFHVNPSQSKRLGFSCSAKQQQHEQTYQGQQQTVGIPCRYGPPKDIDRKSKENASAQGKRVVIQKNLEPVKQDFPKTVASHAIPYAEIASFGS
jgi:hypothetical protein